MPWLHYFGWAGSFLLATLLAINWLFFPQIAAAPLTDVPLDQKVHIRIHTDHKWPERVVLDTTRSTVAHDAKAKSDTDVSGSEPMMPAERPPLEAFAEMAPSARPCFRPPCSAGQAVERETSGAGKRAPTRIRPRMAARKDLTLPNRLHKPPGKS